MGPAIASAALIACASPSPPALPRGTPPASFSESQQPRTDANATNSCEEATRTLLRSLSSPLQIEAVLSRGTPEFDDAATAIRWWLERYRRLSPEKVSTALLDAMTYDGRERARALGLSPVPVSPGSQVADGFEGFGIRYGGELSIIPHLPPGQVAGLGYWINNKIRELRMLVEYATVRVGVVSGAVSLDDTDLVPGHDVSVRSVLARAFPWYEFDEIDLTGSIDPTLNALLFLQPSRALTTEELRTVDNFVMLGERKVAVLASPAFGVLHAPRAVAGSFTPLVSAYGIGMSEDLIVEPTSYWLAPSGGPTDRSVASRVVPEMSGGRGAWIDTLHPAFHRNDDVVLPYASTITLRDPAMAGVRLRALAMTSPLSTSLALNDIPATGAPEALDVPHSPPQSRVVAAIAEGRLPSAFRPSGGEHSRRAESTSSVLVVSSGHMTTNPFLYTAKRSEEGRAANAAAGEAFAKNQVTFMVLAVKNILDWLTTSRAAEACAYEPPPR